MSFAAPKSLASSIARSRSRTTDRSLTRDSSTSRSLSRSRSSSRAGPRVSTGATPRSQRVAAHHATGADQDEMFKMLRLEQGLNDSFASFDPSLSAAGDVHGPQGLATINQSNAQNFSIHTNTTGANAIAPVSFTSSSLLYHNLLLLGLHPQHVSWKFKVQLHERMFEQMNQKLMQTVLHFLLIKIKSYPLSNQHNDTQEYINLSTSLSQCYPCIDRIQCRDFLTVCVAVLLGFEKGDAKVFPAGMIRKSHFSAPQGEKINQIFWHLSTYALHLALMHEFPNYQFALLPLPSNTHANSNELFAHRIRSLQLYTMRELRRFLSFTSLRASSEQQWQESAATLTQQHAQLQQQLQLYNNITPLTNSNPQLYNINNINDPHNDDRLFAHDVVARRHAQVQQLQQAHQQLEQLYQQTKENRIFINQILDGHTQPLSIHSSSSVASDSSSSSSSSPIVLNFNDISASWTQALNEMESVFNKHFQHPVTSEQYRAGLKRATNQLSAHLNDHHQNLVNLRSLSHQLKNNFIPELETDLQILQRNLRAQDDASPFVHSPNTLYENQQRALANQQKCAPVLIPPTPLHELKAPSFTHLNSTPPNFYPVPQADTPLISSATSDPTRLAASIRRATNVSSRTHVNSSLAQPVISVNSTHARLSTIEDNESSITSPHVMGQRLENQTNISHHADQHGLPSSAAKLISPPVVTKKLIFSPDYSSAQSALPSSSPPLSQTSPISPLVHSFVKSPPSHLPNTHAILNHPTSTINQLTPNYNQSQANDIGLFDEKELFSSGSSPSAPLPAPRSNPSSSLLFSPPLHPNIPRAHTITSVTPPFHTSSHSTSIAVSTPTHDIDDDDDDDEIVFGNISPIPSVASHGVDTVSRKSTVDPEAPTPLAHKYHAQRTSIIPAHHNMFTLDTPNASHVHHHSHSQLTPNQHSSASSHSRLLQSPSYFAGGGLLDSPSTFSPL